MEHRVKNRDDAFGTTLGLDRTIGVWLAIAITINTVLFSALMLMGNDFPLESSFSAASPSDRRVAAATGMAFGAPYAGFVTTSTSFN
jgi:protein-disulfide isomerase-like protein with CxxC motif